MKEDKWSFFEMGEPLSFEDLSLYKKRLHKDKMNIDIIFRYLKEMGIYFETIDKKIKECYSFERTTIWNNYSREIRKKSQGQIHWLAQSVLMLFVIPKISSPVMKNGASGQFYP